MNSRIVTTGAALGLAAVLGMDAIAQGAPPPTINDHLAAAKAAAGTEHTGTLARLCILPQAGPGPDVPPAPALDPSRWYTDPAKVFDNLYFVGTKIHSAWALTTSDGIILIDTLYTWASPPAIVEGLKKLGLDPKSVKYTIISHGHGDHVGGAKLMQDLGSRIIMGGPDWDFVEQSVHRFPEKPRRDIIAADGQKVTLDDTTVTLVATPGHTPGTFSMFFEVKDNGKPLTVAYSGGTAFNFVNTVENFDTYIASQRKMAETAARTGATIVMSNHTEFDNAVPKVKAIAARKSGEPHPFDVGKELVGRYFKVTKECAQIARLKLVQAAVSR
jgi:metallo-beta-lactamase class B